MADFVDDLRTLRVGDLVLSGEAKLSQGSDWRSAAWSKVGIVAKADDLDVGTGGTEMIYVDVTSGDMQPLVEAVESIAGDKVTFAARIDARSTGPKPMELLIGKGVDDAVRSAVESGLYDHLDRIVRTCKYDGNERPCPQHG